MPCQHRFPDPLNTCTTCGIRHQTKASLTTHEKRYHPKETKK